MEDQGVYGDGRKQIDLHAGEELMFEVFRSKQYINAIYFDGSFETAVEIAKAFPSVAQIEFTGGSDFLLRVNSQATFIPPHNWVYRNGNDRLEWRDTEELEKKWDKWTPGPMPKKRKGK
jgi:hypothetical protein